MRLYFLYYCNNAEYSDYYESPIGIYSSTEEVEKAKERHLKKGIHRFGDEWFEGKFEVREMELNKDLFNV